MPVRKLRLVSGFLNVMLEKHSCLLQHITSCRHGAGHADLRYQATSGGQRDRVHVLRQSVIQMMRRENVGVAVK